MFESQFAYINPAKKQALVQPLEQLCQQNPHTCTEVKPLLLRSFFAATGAVPVLCLSVCQLEEVKNFPDLTQLNL